MNQAFVSGASGFIGQHLTATLRQSGWRVITLERPDLLDPSVKLGAVEPAQEGGQRVVFHLAGLAHANVNNPQTELERVNVAQTAALYAAAAAAGIDRFVWLSSSKVLGDSSDTALSELAAYAPADPYAESKVAAEQELHARGTREPCQIMIMRPPLVYGPGVKANFLSLLGLAAGRLPLPLGAATQPRSWVAVANLVDAMLFVATASQAEQLMTVHVADAEQTSLAQLLTILRELNGKSAWMLPVPRLLLELPLRLIGKRGVYQRLFEPMLLDTTFLTELGWQPVVDQRNALAEVAEWYRSQA